MNNLWLKMFDRRIIKYTIPLACCLERKIKTKASRENAVCKEKKDGR